MKNKKFFLFAIFLIFTSKLSAETFIFEYSEWSENYPKGVDEWIVESEERYKWTDGEDITEEYYNNYKEGYYKLENNHKTYYRYITNDAVVVDSQNNFVTDLGYCVKEKCYIIKLDKYRNIEEEPETQEKPNTPEDEPNTPEEEPNTPEDEPNTPEEEPNTPEDEPNTPEEEPNTPEDEPNTPEEEPNTPEDEPNTPEEEPNTPEEEPNTPEEEPEEEIVYNPKTADNILYYDILLFLCLTSILIVMYKQKIILVLSKRFKKNKNHCNIES